MFGSVVMMNFGGAPRAVKGRLKDRLAEPLTCFTKYYTLIYLCLSTYNPIYHAYNEHMF